jgi:predicted PurR-regulated permease PerM
MVRLEEQTRLWLLILAFFIAAIWLLKPVLLPFLAGLAVAYFLNPAVEKLAKHGFPRWLGALVVLGAFVLVMAMLVVLALPLLQGQLGALIEAVPAYVSKLRLQYLPWAEGWLSRFEPDDIEKIRDAAGQSVGEAAGWVAQTLKSVISSGIALIDALALTIITPVVAFHVMRDWAKLTSTIDALIPPRYYATIREQLSEIDATLSGFIRGQALVCLALGIIYSVGLSACGLKYGATIGIIAGVLTIIPYVGTVFGWATSFILACVQFEGNWLRIGLIMAVFAIGHFFEAYVLTPRLVGKRVGLHPVWVLFALIAGVKLMGFTGVLIAVPFAAVVGVLLRFATRQYRASSLYQ